MAARNLGRKAQGYGQVPRRGKKHTERPRLCGIKQAQTNLPVNPKISADQANGLRLITAGMIGTSTNPSY
jgi:hypothetical protein